MFCLFLACTYLTLTVSRSYLQCVESISPNFMQSQWKPGGNKSLYYIILFPLSATFIRCMQHQQTQFAKVYKNDALMLIFYSKVKFCMEVTTYI